MSKKAYTAKQSELVLDMVERGEDRDSVIIALHGTGLSLAKASAVFRKVCEDNGIETRTRIAGFRSNFYDWLKEGKRSMKEVQEYVEEHGTDNDRRHLTHYQGIAELANAIHG